MIRPVRREAPAEGARATGHAPLQRLADASAPVAQLRGLQALASRVIQRKEWYEYGAANSVPHIHCYKSGCHLKILLGKSVKRLNLVQDGVRYEGKIAEAREAAAGNDALLAAIDSALDHY
jgi:hypothetical protein